MSNFLLAADYANEADYWEFHRDWVAEQVAQRGAHSAHERDYREWQVQRYRIGESLALRGVAVFLPVNPQHMPSEG